MQQSSDLTRRRALLLGAGTIGATAFPGSLIPAYAKNNAEEVIKRFAGGKQPISGKVKLDLPDVAEDGNTVPMTVSVESPMTAQSYVTDVLVVADENPRPGLVTFHFTPASGVAEASTRIRLISSQNITAVAKMNDGTFYIATRQVKVTVGGCAS